MDTKKFTDEYIASANPAELNAERKELIRHYTACQDISRKMRDRLASENEDKHAEHQLGQLSDVRRQALERAIAKGKITGSGTVG